MAFDIATLNARIGRAANTPTSLGWMRDNTKPSYRSYGLQNMAGFYWFPSSLSGWTGSTWNCNGVINTSGGDSWNDNCIGSQRLIAGPNCCQDGAVLSNCNCNCMTNCNNCYIYDTWGQCGYVANWDALTRTNCYQCLQCDIQGNCDSRAWLQPNCNCIQCNCACNCYAAGACQVRATGNCSGNCK